MASPQPIKVLLLSPHGAGEHYHGAGTTFFRMYSKLDPNEAQVTLLHGSVAQRPSVTYQETVNVGEIGNGAFSQRNFIKNAKAWIRDNIESFDVLHSTMGYQIAMEPTHYAQSLGCPCVLTISSHQRDLGGHASLPSRILGLPRKRQKMARELSAMIATSQSIYDELVTVGVEKDRIARIPYGVDIDRFHPCEANQRQELRAELGLADTITFVFVGYIHRRKRPHLLVEAMGLIKQELGESPFQVVFVGPHDDPEYMNEIKNMGSENEVSQHVHWAGFTKNVELYFRASDVFVLPSEGEGLPNAMLEAMSCGLPILGTRISGILDLVDGERNGFLVDPNASSLAEKMRRYCEDAKLLRQHGQNARDFIESQYSAQSVLNQYLELFRKVISETKY